MVVHKSRTNGPESRMLSDVYILTMDDFDKTFKIVEYENKIWDFSSEW